jgi:hypothetical protein
MCKTAAKTTSGRRTALRLGSVAGLMLGLLLGPGCAPDPAPSDDSDLNGDLHPRTLFAVRVLPLLSQTCLPCHAMAQGAVDAFLPSGTEYQAIVGYKGGRFLASPTIQSPLLQKGQHVGPALTTEQFAAVNGWLEAEAATRASTGQRTALLPTVPVADGDYNMSFEDLDPVLDPQANLTFTLQESANHVFRVSNLKLTTSSATGIRVKHPIFYFLSARGSAPDPADSLSSVDLTVDASDSRVVGPGTVLLTEAPDYRIARLGVAFQRAERSVSTNPVDEKCKAFKLFAPAVTSLLSSCAGQCHANGRNNVAIGAFNMAAATSSDPKQLQDFCLSTRGRVDRNTPASSILIRQITPPAQGGTPNHPFKLTDDAARQRFSSAVQTWAAAEK